MAKGKPKRDGSGGGTRKNQGRGEAAKTPRRQGAAETAANPSSLFVVTRRNKTE